MMTAVWIGMCVVPGLVLLYLLMIMPRMLHRADRTPFEKVFYAHRGLYDNASGEPENSMEAFRRAVEAGFGIELDVQLSKDEIPVVFHDFTLQRVCGEAGKVADYTFEELQRFSLCSSGQKIPRFEEVLKLVDGRVPLIIEYKIPGGDNRVCAIADRLLQAYKGVYCIESFNPLGLFWYRQNRKEILRGQLAENFIRAGETEFPKLLYFVLHHLLLNFVTKPDFIAYNYKHRRDLSRQLCRKLYGGLSVAWTIKDKEALEAEKDHFDLFIFEGFLPESRP